MHGAKVQSIGNWPAHSLRHPLKYLEAYTVLNNKPKIGLKEKKNKTRNKKPGRKFIPRLFTLNWVAWQETSLSFFKYRPYIPPPPSLCVCAQPSPHFTSGIKSEKKKCIPPLQEEEEPTLFCVCIASVYLSCPASVMEVILISTDRTTTTNHHANELSHQLAAVVLPGRHPWKNKE